MNYWLMKTEPSSYSIDDLARDGRTFWSGVRNFQARNFMRDQMKIGDRVLFYHSNADPSGVVGIAEVCKAGYPDFTAWDKKDSHYDPKSSQAKPLWFMVDVKFISQFKKIVSLADLKANPQLESMMVLQKGSRLSVQPVSHAHFEEVCRMGRGKGSSSFLGSAL